MLRLTDAVPLEPDQPVVFLALGLGTAGEKWDPSESPPTSFLDVGRIEFVKLRVRV